MGMLNGTLRSFRFHCFLIYLYVNDSNQLNLNKHVNSNNQNELHVKCEDQVIPTPTQALFLNSNFKTLSFRSSIPLPV